MNHLYETATGKLISSTALDIDNIPAGMAVKVSNLKGTWNTSTLDFDPIPVKKIVDRFDFMELFTDAELIAILDAAKVNTAVEVFVKKLDLAPRVDLDSSNVVNGLASLEAAGLIAVGRASEIRNG